MIIGTRPILFKVGKILLKSKRMAALVKDLANALTKYKVSGNPAKAISIVLVNPIIVLASSLINSSVMEATIAWLELNEIHCF